MGEALLQPRLERRASAHYFVRLGMAFNARTYLRLSASGGAPTCIRWCLAIFAIKTLFDGAVPLREAFQRFARHLHVVQLCILIRVAE